MRHPRKAGKQNMGFSLVEVLVTLALISVLSIPLIQTFLNSARMNGKAKVCRMLQTLPKVSQNTLGQCL